MKKFTILLALLTIGLTCNLYSTSKRVSQIPNGNVSNCQNCHVYADPNSQGTNTNPFGNTIRTSYLDASGNVTWGPALATIDSDGDGFTNGTELQDPTGAWRTGQPNPGNPALVSNPGNSGSIPTGVEEDLANLGFAINTISPNPTSGSATISISIDLPGYLKINIYDMSGTVIKSFNPELSLAGTYNILWNATDNDNHEIPAGNYFIAVSLNDKMITRKIVVVR